MRTTACLLGAALLAALPLSRSQAAEQENKNAERPNILFIMSDDHGWQAISAYGSNRNETPNIDRLAKEGMRFDRCFVTNSICGPSRAVILTGKYSHLNGFVRNGNRFNGQQQTVQQLMREAGYQTAMIGKWHLGSEPTGFDYYHVLRGQGPYYNPPMLTSDGPVKHTGYTTDIITDQALDWLKNKREENKPFLMFYQHKAPHRNWQPGPEYLNKYDGEEIPEPDTLFDDYEGRGSAAKQQKMTVANDLNASDLKLRAPGNLTEEQREAWDAAYEPKNEAFREANLEGKELVRWKYQRYVKDYLRAVASVDDNIGRVLDYLDDSGLADNTIVIYTSDQGWFLGEHGWYDKRWMYEESFRTPLLVRWPGKIKAGSTSDALSLNLDFPETFLDVAGADIPDDMQGRSLKPILLNAGEAPEDWRDAVYYHYYEYPGPHSVRRHYGVRTDRYKLIYFYNLDEWELYDLEKDPDELQSVYDDPAYADVVRRMKAKLKELREKYKDDGTVIDFSAERARNTKPKLVQKWNFAKIGSGELQNAEVVEGVRGKAIQLDGQGAAWSASSSGKLDPSAKTLTVGAWVKPQKQDGVVIAHGGESLGYSLYFKEGRPYFAVRDSGNLYLVEGPSNLGDEWVHLAGMLNAEGEAVLWVNGEPAAETKAAYIGRNPNDGLTIGADGGSRVGEYDSSLPFTGRIEDVRLYWAQPSDDEFAKWSSQ